MENVATKIRVNVGKLKMLEGKQEDGDYDAAAPTNKKRNNNTNSTGISSPELAAAKQIKLQQTLLLDTSLASKAAALLPIPPPPPVCIGRSAVINPTMQQSSLLGTLLEDVMDSYDTANTNVYRTVKTPS